MDAFSACVCVMQPGVLGAPPSLPPAQRQALLPLPSPAQQPMTPQATIPARQQPQGQGNGAGLLPAHLKQRPGLSASPQPVKEPAVHVAPHRDSHSPQPPFSQHQRADEHLPPESSARPDPYHSPRPEFHRPPVGVSPRPDFHRPPMGRGPRGDFHRPPMDPGSNFRQPRPGFQSGPRPRLDFHRGPIEDPPWTGMHLDGKQPRPRHLLHEPRGTITEKGKRVYSRKVAVVHSGGVNV